ncbi:MAG: hypothetical protein AAB353_09675 [Candidatus Hydrogenedentota bacterium]
MTLLDALNSETGLTLVSGAVGAAWTFFKSQDWMQGLRRRRARRAIQAIEAGVDKAYRTYVREIKRAREDGDLTREEIDQARRLARRTAIDYGRNEGIDVLRELGEDFVNLWITRLVNRAKRTMAGA